MSSTKKSSASPHTITAPNTRAGDGFYAASRHLECPACYEGVVYLTYEDIAPGGDEVEVLEAVPCRRCADSR
jgi:hypothetical protein